MRLYAWMTRSACVFIALFITGCLEYEEEWYLDADGGGRVLVRCAPAGAWRQTIETENSAAAQALFMPHLDSISQACVSADIALDTCRVLWRDTVPVAEIECVFDDITALEDVPLFSGRHISWQKWGWAITFRHSFGRDTYIPAGAALAACNDAADGTVTLRWHMPYRIIHARGACTEGKTVTVQRSLRDLLASPRVPIVVQCRGMEIEAWLTGVLVIMLCTATITWVMYRRA